MNDSPTTDVTELLVAWRNGDGQALEQLAPLVYRQLHQLAHGQMRRERRNHELQTTALIHEAYIRLAGADTAWQDRNHFFAVAAQVMRRVLVDFARRRGSAKRGGGIDNVSLDTIALEGIAEEGIEVGTRQAPDLLDLHAALGRLERLEERKSKILELRFFGGLTINEIADVLNLSPRTVERDLKFAKAWLAAQLGPNQPDREDGTDPPS